MKKRTLFISAGLILILLGGAVGLYFAGVFVPNYPSKREYPIRGIDVSNHQGEIDWTAVPHKEVAFVYMKATEGGDFRDRRFAENWKNSKAAGFKRGAYHFFSLKTPGAQQAANFIATVPKDELALPPAIDLEYHGNTSYRPSVAEFQEQLTQFITAIKQHYGCEPVLYTASDFIDPYLVDYPISRLWIRAVVLTPRPPWLFWQYSEKGKVRGIEGWVDQNVFSGSQKELDVL